MLSEHSRKFAKDDVLVLLLFTLRAAIDQQGEAKGVDEAAHQASHNGDDTKDPIPLIEFAREQAHTHVHKHEGF